MVRAMAVDPTGGPVRSRRGGGSVGAVATDTFTDEELTELALAVAPEPEVDASSPSLWELTEPHAEGLLPAWYMPSAHAGTRRLVGWRRNAVFAVVTAFVAIDAVGLCSTYGPIIGG